ncbi:MAG: TonB family protein [Vicinamibacterales bacterium]
MLICVACGRRCDPNRSFCSNCGSAVFVDSNDRSRVMAAVRDEHINVEGATAPVRAKARLESRARQTRTQAPVASGSGPWSLIKFGVFLYIVYKAYGFVAGIPDVGKIFEQVQRDGDIQPALDAIGHRIESLMNGTSTPDDTSTTPESAPLPAEPPAARAEPERAVTGAGEVTPPPANDAQTDAAQARVVRKVSPEYTPEATRAKIEGTVLLRALVQPDGTVTNVSVIRSLDKQYGLDEQAMMALRQWRFEPSRRNGEPARSVVQVQMTFNLR